MTRRSGRGNGRRYVAFLRAINVGGRYVRMERLREIFTSLGFSGVETFIASGNVIFHADVREAAALEREIEAALQTSLGYPVATFVRLVSDLDAIARHQPFAGESGEAEAGTVYVGFLRSAVTPAAARKIRGCRTDLDELDVKGRELYWLVRGSLLDSKLSGAGLERMLGPTTMRNRNTILRLVKKYAAAG
jgi:uncharacterized protein (DUF1697 family)